MQDGYVIDSGTRMNALNVSELTMICFTAEGVFGLLFRGGGVSLTVLTMYPSRCSVGTTGCVGDTVILSEIHIHLVRIRNSTRPLNWYFKHMPKFLTESSIAPCNSDCMLLDFCSRLIENKEN